MKKIFLWIIVLFSICFWNITYSVGCDPYDLASSCYTVDTIGLWLGWGEINNWGSAKDTVEIWLALIVNKLMIWFWVLSLFIMTVGWGYMIFAHGQDELLNKWKSIFSAWIISLTVALWAWIIMKIVISLLY